MTQVNIFDAKTNLSQLIKLLETKQEDEIIIARNGKPAAKLILFVSRENNKRTGLFNGQMKSMTQEEFDSVNKEIWGDLY